MPVKHCPWDTCSSDSRFPSFVKVSVLCRLPNQRERLKHSFVGAKPAGVPTASPVSAKFSLFFFFFFFFSFFFLFFFFFSFLTRSGRNFAHCLHFQVLASWELPFCPNSSSTRSRGKRRWWFWPAYPLTCACSELWCSPSTSRPPACARCCSAHVETAGRRRRALRATVAGTEAQKKTPSAATIWVTRCRKIRMWARDWARKVSDRAVQVVVHRASLASTWTLTSTGLMNKAFPCSEKPRVRFLTAPKTVVLYPHPAAEATTPPTP